MRLRIRRNDRYTYRVTWSAEDGEYVGLCAEFPSLSWLASTPQAALKGIRKTVAKVAEDLKANKEPIPGPLGSRRFNGKFMTAFDKRSTAFLPWRPPRSA